MAEQEYYVYVLEVVSTKEVFYCGKGKNRRVYEHRFRAKDQTRSRLYLYRKINKLWEDGDDYTERIVFTTDIEQEAYDKEVELIAIFGRENLCNLTEGGDGSSFKEHTEETKKKIGDKNRGRKHTPETIEKMREVHTGHYFTPEQLQGLSDKVWENPERLEHLRKIAAEGCKKIRRVDTGEIFDSLKLAAESVNRKSNTLSHSLKENKSCNGIMFEYLDKQENKIHKPERCGVKMTDEQKYNKSQSFHNHPEKEQLLEKLRKQAADTAKSVIRMDTGEIFESISAAARILECSPVCLAKPIQQGKMYKGIKFEYYTGQPLTEFTPIQKHTPKTQRMVRRTDDYTIPEMTLEAAATSIGRTKESLYNSIRKSKECGGIKWEYSIDFWNKEEEIRYLPTCYV